ncbi:hypothetical protein ACIOHS_48575 [Streptomyces sp. NPDC088253]|uniref:hypothetical protein n=1 Tax=Streptomyces sp. NPDC088253 TaxID=3365846 RepID=UPI0037FB1C15
MSRRRRIEVVVFGIAHEALAAVRGCEVRERDAVRGREPRERDAVHVSVRTQVIQAITTSGYVAVTQYTGFFLCR